MYNVEGGQWLLDNIDVRGKSVLELGNQHVWVHAMPRLGIRFPVARDWFTKQLGAKEYVSIDTNKEDGAVPMDLAEPLAPAYRLLLDHFDLVTNIGTTEHVGKSARVQWNAFAHAVNFCKPLGDIVMHLPPAGQWLDHCDVWYKPGLGHALEVSMDVRLIDETIMNLPTLNPDADYLCVHLKKRFDAPHVPYDAPTPMFEEKLHRA